MPEFDDQSINRIVSAVRRVERWLPDDAIDRKPTIQKYAFELVEDADPAGSSTNSNAYGKAKAKIKTRDRAITLIDEGEIRYTEHELDGAKKGEKGECSPWADYFMLEQKRTALFRFYLLEDVNGAPEDIYRADITTLRGSAVAQKAELVDTFGWMASLQLRAGDPGLCDRDGALFYFVTGDCGSMGDCVDGPFIRSGDADPGITGTPYTWTPLASGTAVDVWAAVDLPPGLSIDSSTGTISGTPTEAGEYLITLTATGTDNCVATKVIKLSVEDPPPPPPPPGP